MTFDLETTIDASRIGGSAAEPIALRFATDTDTIPSPETRYLTIFGTGVDYVGTTTTSFGGRTFVSTGSLTVVDDAYDPAVGSSSGRGDRLYFDNDVVTGDAVFDDFLVDSFRFALLDTSATLFDDHSLPTTFAASDFDAVRVSVWGSNPARGRSFYGAGRSGAPDDLRASVSTGTVPEPHSLALLGLGALVAGARHRRTAPHRGRGRALA